jgi:hypothetical protein
MHSLLDLHGRQLNFRTDFRPRDRYVWWTFMKAILVNGWRQKQTEHIHPENGGWQGRTVLGYSVGIFGRERQLGMGIIHVVSTVCLCSGL